MRLDNALKRLHELERKLSELTPEEKSKQSEGYWIGYSTGLNVSIMALLDEMMEKVEA